MGLLTTYKTLNKWQKIGLWTGLFLIFYTIFGFFILPKIIQKVSVDKLTQALERQVSISRIKINPYSLFLTIEELNIKEKNSDKTFFSFDKVFVNVQTSSIFRLGPVIREVRVDGLFLNVTRHKDQTYNFSDLIPAISTDQSPIKQKENTKAPAPLKFSVSNIVLNNGKIIINDLPKGKTHTFTEMELAIPFISNLNTHTDIFVTPHFAVNFNGSLIAIAGESKPFMASQTTSMDLDLKGIDLKTYYDYIPFKTNMDLKSGTMDLFCSVEFSQHEDRERLPRILLSGRLKVFRFEINDLNANSLFKMGELSLAINQSEILKGDINIKEVIVSTPTISLALNDANQLNIYDLMPESKSDTKIDSKKDDTKKPLPVKLNCEKIAISNALVTLKDASDKKDIFSIQNFTVEDIELSTDNRLVNIGKVSGQNGSLNVYRLINNHINLEALLPPQNSATKPEPESDKESTSAWNANIANLDFKKFSIIANDLISKGKGQILLDNITLNSTGFSTLPETKAESDLSFHVNKDGRVNISGKMGINPLSADAALTVNQIHLAGFQPFVSEYLNLIISKGNFSTSGQFSMEKPNKTTLKADYQGDLDIADFQIVDSEKAKNLVKFKNLGVKGMKLDISPISASIKTLTINKPVLNVAMYSDGSLNFSKIAKTTVQDKNESDKDKPDKDKQSTKDSTIPVKIGQVIMTNGQIVFNDKSMAPNFKTRLTRINAKITGLSSDETIQSNIKINAMVNNHTPVEIKGKINPLSTDFFCDMVVACSDMDLGYLSPYSGKYAGYKIEKGKLSLDLKYLVDKRKIDFENNIFLDQFDFGAKVDSEDAINAPMNLAVSLLKDPMGRISLDIPVKGSLDDPKFSVAGIIIKIIVNLLIKAATSPFSLLGAMFGGGEDLNIIVFDAGSFNLTSNGTKKVETLVKALSQRPGLNLEIAGYVNINKDRFALIDMKFEQQLKAEKLKILLKQGNSGVLIDEIQLSDEEYDIYFKAVFDQTEEGIKIAEKTKNQKESKQKNTATDSEASEITRDQMIQIIKKGTQVPDDELRYLASDRALAVQGAILADGKIDPKRVFVIEANTLEPERSDVPEESDETKTPEEPAKSEDKDKADQTINSGSVIMTLK